jgi:predicted TIM-barrel fold metal-dependent hydrolase
LLSTLSKAWESRAHGIDEFLTPEENDYHGAMASDTLIDVHAHYLTDRYVEAAKTAGVVHPDGMPAWPSWTVEDHLGLMEQTRTARAILSISSPGVHFGDDDAAAELARHVNEFAADVAAEHRDRFEFFASVPLPCVEAAVDEAAFAMDHLGARGVVLFSNSAGLYLGDPALDPLWRVLNERRAIVFEHPTSPPNADAVALGRPRPMLEFLFETTRTVTDLMFAAVPERHPDISFVIPHSGATLSVVADRIEFFRSLLPGSHGRPASTQTTQQQLQRSWYDLAGMPFPAAAKALVDVVGSGQVLFGSDYCWTPAMLAAQQVTILDQQPTDWRTVTTANAGRLFGESRYDDRTPQ